MHRTYTTANVIAIAYVAASGHMRDETIDRRQAAKIKSASSNGRNVTYIFKIIANLRVKNAVIFSLGRLK